jgi:IS5 family transposase
VQGFTDRARSARRRMQQIQRMTASQRQQQQETKYRELLRITADSGDVNSAFRGCE